MLMAIVGINWGDEGKGRMVDYFSNNFDVVVRYQGGNNAGHTVINDRGKFILNLLPSGILNPKTVNVMGPGMVVDIKHLCGELKSLRDKGIEITKDNLKISDRAVITMPYNVLRDCLEEERLADAKFGSTRRGIAPIYSDKYMKKALKMADLFDMETTKKRLEGIVEWENLMIVNGYKAEPIKVEDMVKYLEEYGNEIKQYVCDTTHYLHDAAEEGKNVMFEAQLGALRDIDYGIYPYTSSSSTIAGYATVGAGIPGKKLDKVVGIMKAYSSCVGEGPFTCEMFDEEGDKLREAGGEYGAATGRPRRVGGFDVVASKYGVMMQGADSIALTKLDVLSYFDKIPVCVAYEVNGKRVDRFPYGHELEIAKPIYEYLDGFNEDISKCRKFEDLPKAAQDYVNYIEKAVGCPVEYVSVGAEREALIVR
ncbi:MAG: adenylosuccinate synthase [Parasporobacterium sp.]|nr:adenylosuccinate synthase [Parasporobacterium sp.]